MNDLKLGTPPAEGAQRDAIHVAIAPCVAAMGLKPGDPVKLDKNGKAIFSLRSVAVGVVDPFLASHVNMGERFWLLLHQGTVSNLRHAWSHPSFPDQIAVTLSANEHEAYLRQFAAEAGGTYEGLLQELGEFSMGDNNTFVYRGKVVGEFDGFDPEDSAVKPEDTSYDLDARGWSRDTSHVIWKHYKAITGISPWDKDCRGCN